MAEFLKRNTEHALSEALAKMGLRGADESDPTAPPAESEPAPRRKARKTERPKAGRE